MCQKKNLTKMERYRKFDFLSIKIYYRYMKLQKILVLAFVILLFVQKTNYAVTPLKQPMPEFYKMGMANSFKNITSVEVNKLSAEINSMSQEFPIYVSEINSGIIYFIDYTTNGMATSREFYFSAFDSTTHAWSKPINLQKDYASFSEYNKNMNYNEIYISIENDLYVVNLKGKNFKPQKLNINTNSIESSPSISPDGNTLYFVSDRKGSIGGKDIWASEKLENGKWSMPYNLGEGVNTKEDEESPFMMIDGATLYFSSKGHYSYGGYDIFTVTMNEEGGWGNLEQLGVLINSASDDTFYISDAYGENAFYSSDKMEKGNKDIFYINYEEPLIKY